MVAFNKARSDVEARQQRRVIGLLSAAFGNLSEIEEAGVSHWRIREAKEIIRQELAEALVIQMSEELGVE